MSCLEWNRSPRHRIVCWENAAGELFNRFIRFSWQLPLCWLVLVRMAPLLGVSECWFSMGSFPTDIDLMKCLLGSRLPCIKWEVLVMLSSLSLTSLLGRLQTTLTSTPPSMSRVSQLPLLLIVNGGTVWICSLHRIPLICLNILTSPAWRKRMYSHGSKIWFIPAIRTLRRSTALFRPGTIWFTRTLIWKKTCV